MPVGTMTTRPAPKPDPWDFETLLTIDKRIDTREDENIRDRWEFGRVMLAARDGKKRLPNGYLAELVKATGKSQRELSNRLRCADVYPTEVELCNALQSCPSWHEMAENLYAKPDAKPKPNVPQPESQPKSQQAESDSGPAPTPKPDEPKPKPKGQAPVETNDGLPPIDPASMSMTAQKKVEVLVRRRNRELEAEFEPRVQAEVERREDAAFKRIREMYNRIERFEWDQKHGQFTEKEFREIERCLHPDTATTQCDDPACPCHTINHVTERSVSKQKLSRAIQLFRSAGIKLVPPPRPTDLPSTWEEMEKRRAQKQYEDRLKRQQRKQQREQQQDAPPSAPEGGG
jgi:hypothetical protein